MSEPTTSSRSETSANLAELETQLKAASEKNQLQLIDQIAGTGEAGLTLLQEFLQGRLNQPVNFVDGKVYQVLVKTDSAAIAEFLATSYPRGLVPLQSMGGIDYSPIQDCLAKQDFQGADRLSMQKLCELAGPKAIERKWLYFTEIDKFPIQDLQTLDQLWRIYSEGKFGLSIQREIWLGVGKNWDKLWPKIGWKNGNTWTRYPGEFTWDLTAPRGHLPLSNQLRGVRVIEKLLTHPAWD
jgi:hypothetical protein